MVSGSSIQRKKAETKKATALRKSVQKCNRTSTLASSTATSILPANAAVIAANNTAARKRRERDAMLYMDLSPTISATNTVQNDNSSTSPENDALSALLTWQSPLC